MKTPDPNLATHRFLEHLSPDYLETIAECATPAEFQTGQILFREGEIADKLFLIQHGKVALETTSPGRPDILIQTVGDGEALGWSWLFAPFNWHFSARALAPIKAFAVKSAHLLVACEENHPLGCELMRRISQILIQRLQSTREQLLQLEGRPWKPLVEANAFARTSPQFASADSLEAMVAAHPFLRGMSPQHCKVLAEVAMPVRFDAGQLIFREGEIANRFYLLQSGKVTIESSNTEGGPVTIQLLEEGDVLGWSWLFPPYYWHFDARALEPTRAIFFYGTRLREQCDSDPDLGFALMKRVTEVLIHRLQATRKQLVAATQKARASGEPP